jgi:HK97 family phage portal protein
VSVLRNALERRSISDLDAYGDSYGYGGGWTQGMARWRSGNAASSEQAMRLTAVFACLRLLSEGIATLPLDTFIRSNGTRRPWPRPDYLNFGQPGLSRIDYLSQVMLSLLTDGNAYVLTPRRADGSIITLIVLDPARVVVSRVHGQLVYRCNNVKLDPITELMHIKGMCLPGQIVGVSPIAYAAETVGVGLNAQRYGSSFFENGALASAVIETPDKFSDEAAKRFRDTWNAGHEGVGNGNKIGVLTNGAKLTKVSIAPEEAQFLETRQFTVPDVARIYGVPPHLIADASNSTSWGSGLSEQNLAFGQFSLRPWTERVEEGHGRLLTLDGLPDVFMKLNMDAVLRASLKDRYESYQIAIEGEFMVPNEARALEDMPPVPWGNAPSAVPTGGSA